jgi:hypothetical protein
MAVLEAQGICLLLFLISYQYVTLCLESYNNDVVTHILQYMVPAFYVSCSKLLDKCGEPRV